MDISNTIYRKPIYQTRAADRNRCPFCDTEDFRAPGPCRKCGVHGYHGAPPGLQRGRVWRRRGRDFEPVDSEGDEPQEYDGNEEELDTELTLSDLEEISIYPDDFSGMNHIAHMNSQVQ